MIGAYLASAALGYLISLFQDLSTRRKNQMRATSMSPSLQTTRACHKGSYETARMILRTPQPSVRARHSQHGSGFPASSLGIPASLPVIPAFAGENTARQGPLDHRGGENATHELCLANTLRSSPPGGSPVDLRIEIHARFLHDVRLPPACLYPRVLDRARARMVHLRYACY
jgi:hypothetical protein